MALLSKKSRCPMPKALKKVDVPWIYFLKINWMITMSERLVYMYIMLFCIYHTNIILYLLNRYIITKSKSYLLHIWNLQATYPPPPPPPPSDWEEVFAKWAIFSDFEIFNGPFLIILHRLLWAIFQVNGTMAHGPLPSQSLPPPPTILPIHLCTCTFLIARYNTFAALYMYKS